MKLSDLLEACEAEAIYAKLQSGEASVWRYICRKYSEKFSTPLHVVMNELPPEDVILAHYESELDDFDVEENIEKVLDMVYSLQDPEYAKQKRDDLAADIARFEAEEEKRIAEGRPIHKAMKNEYNPLGPDPVKIEKSKGPSSGFVDFSKLKDESSGGFEE